MYLVISLLVLRAGYGIWLYQFLIIAYLFTFLMMWLIIGWLCWGLTSQSTIFQSCRDGAIASWVINQYFRPLAPESDTLPLSHRAPLMWLIRAQLSFSSPAIIQTIPRFEPHRDKTNKMACAPSEDSDQPGHPPSLIRVFAVHLKKVRILSYPLSGQRRLWSDWADAQAVLSLPWVHMPFCWFYHDTVHLSLYESLMGVRCW